MAEEFADAGKTADWKSCVWPVVWCNDEEQPLSQDPEAWSATNPRFVNSAMPAAGDTENCAAFQEQWESSVLTNWLAVAITEIDSDAGAQKLLSYCEIFLEGVTDSAISSLPEFLQESGFAMLKLLRGFLALLDTTPGRCGATAADVDFICPLPGSEKKKKKSDAPVAAPLDKALVKGKVFARILTKSEDWQRRATQYRRYSGAALERGPLLTNMVEQVEEKFSVMIADHSTLAQAPEVKKCECLQFMIDECAGLSELREALAPQATARCELALFKYAQDFWAALDRRSPAGIALLEILSKFTGMLTGPGVKSLQQDIHELMTSWQESTSLGHLRRITALTFQTHAEVIDYLECFKQGKNIEKPPDMIDAFSKNYDDLVKFVSTSCSGELPGHKFQQELELFGLLDEELGADPKAALEDVAMFTKVIKAFILWKDNAAALEMDSTAATQEVVDASVEAQTHMLTLISKSDNLVQNTSAAIRIAIPTILNAASKEMEKVRQTISPVADKVLAGCYGAMNRTVAELKPKALGGAAPGTSWTEGLAEDADIGKWFLETLDKVDTAGIDSRINKLEQAGRGNFQVFSQGPLGASALLRFRRPCKVR